MRNNPVYQIFVQMSLALIFISPIFTASRCSSLNRPSQFPLESFVLFSCLISFFDSYLYFKSNHWTFSPTRGFITNSLRRDNSHRWFLCGLLSNLLIILNQLFHMSLGGMRYFPNLCKGLFVVRI